MRYVLVPVFAFAFLLVVGWYLSPDDRDQNTNLELYQSADSVGRLRLAEPEVTASFLAVGDILLSRYVAARMEQQRDPLLPFRNLTDLFHSTDFNFGNLESPISGRDEVRGRGLIFNMATKDLAGLVANNFKIVNLANNHALDQRLTGLENTRRLLDDKRIAYVGAGGDKAAAWEPKIVEVNGIRIGFLGASYSSVNDGGATRNQYLARIEDLAELRDAIRRMKTSTDFVVVTMHAGIEFERYPHPSQIKFAHAAVDYGADLVIGAHPHWIQTMEEYQGKYIFYSLGNFIFDANHEDTSQGLTLRIALRKPRFANPMRFTSPPKSAARLDSIELIPIVIQQFSPRPTTAEESRQILQKIGITESVIRFDTRDAQPARPGFYSETANNFRAGN